MHTIETRIKNGLRKKGIICQSVYTMPDLDNPRLLLAFSSKENQRLTPAKIEKTLNSLGLGEFKALSTFHRLSAAFLHLEVKLGARTKNVVPPNAG